jgi:DNA-binding NarL/FixJ family response regulator
MQRLIIYIADDHNIVAQGIASLLKQIDSVSNIFIFKNGSELYNKLSNQTPDIVFLDIEMPIWDGRKTLEEIRKLNNSTKCFMLSMINEKHIIEDCIKKGANGYLNKDCSLEELSEAVHSSENEIYYSKEVLKTLSGLSSKSDNTLNLLEPLSEREQEILILLCDGLTPKEIAEKLFLSQRTIETHKTNIMHKFDVNSVGKLISVAIKNKVV